MTIRFDFGPEGEAEAGYSKVSAGDAYHSGKGYGFVDCSRVSAISRGDDRLSGDFCIPFGTSFVVDVEDGNYLITMLIGDALAPTCTTLKTNASGDSQHGWG